MTKLHPTNSTGPVLVLTNPQVRIKLEQAASKMLRKARFFGKRRQTSEIIDADCCGVNGLRPTWHGRAS